jgi:hypothetical protein
MLKKPIAGVLLTNSQIWRDVRMLDQEKVTAVRDYLQTEFPNHSIDDWYDPERKAQTFRVSAQGSTYQAIVAQEFLDDHEVAAIGLKLKIFTLAEHLRDLPSDPVIVTSHGLKLDY